MPADVTIRDKNGANSLTLNVTRITYTLDRKATQFGINSTSSLGQKSSVVIDLGEKTEKWHLEGYITSRADMDTYITRMKTTYFAQKPAQVRIGAATRSPTNNAFENCAVESFNIDITAAEGVTSETDFLYRWRLILITNITVV